MASANVQPKIGNVLMDGRFGGPQNRILQVATELKAHGIETVVIVPEKDSDYFRSQLAERGIPVRALSLHRLTTARKSDFIAWALFFVPEVLTLRRCLRDEKVHLVHCNGSTQLKDVLAGKLAGAKIIWHLNDTWTPLPVKLLFFMLSPLADGFIISGQRVRKYYLGGRRHGKKRIMEIVPPVDPTKFDPTNTTEDPRIMDNPGLQITMTAIITPTKGIEHFLGMARILNQKYRDLTFNIVGPQLNNYADYAKSLVQMAQNYQLENAHFHGPADNVASVLKATDIFVGPSLSESGPMVVWEAMMMEKPVVSTDVGDVARYLRDGENGFVVPIKDAHALAEKVELLIQDEEMRHRFGKLARVVALDHFDVKMIADKHQRFYREIVNGSPDARSSNTRGSSTRVS